MTKKAPEETPDPQSFLPLTPAVFHIMLSLAIGEGHGYGIMLEVEQLDKRTALNLGPGTLYRSIQRDAPRWLDRGDEGCPGVRRR